MGIDSILKRITSREKQLVPKRIIASVGDEAALEQNRNDIYRIVQGGEKIDFYGYKPILDKNKIKNDGDKTFVLSAVNERDKWTEELYDCTSVIAVGTSESGKEISLLTHQDPYYFLQAGRTSFIQKLGESLDELVAKSKKNTVDVVIVGGKYEDRASETPKKEFAEAYRSSIKLLREVIQEHTGVEPDVVIGPNRVSHQEQRVALNTQKRRLFVQRHDQSTAVDTNHNVSYPASKLSEVERTWNM